MSIYPVPRYAVYFVPPADSSLYQFGSAMLGYDAIAGKEVPQIVPAGFDLASWRTLTARPRIYGLHATIKAPLRLVEGKTEESLVVAFSNTVAGMAPFTLPYIRLTTIDHRESEGAFIALMEPEPTPALAKLEREVLISLEPFRAALTDKEYCRRRPEMLTQRQRQNLNAYGYPYVLEDFRFHMTLSGRVPEAQLEKTREELNRLYEEHVGDHALLVDSLALYKQEAGENHFKLLTRAPFSS